MKPLHKLFILFICLFSFSIQSCEQIDGLNLENCFDSLSGTWVRVSSTNSSGDCMKVVLTGNQGLLFENPRYFSGWETGKVIWKDIEHVEEFTKYETEILASDGNYYSASMELTDSKTLKVSIESSGSGAEQTWVKVEGTEVPTQCNNALVEGAWTRTQSTNSSLDGMQIEVTGSEATIIFLPSGNAIFKLEDILWKDIERTSNSNEFSLKVLGSDYQYYNAALSIYNQKLELSIDAGGSGFEQIWER